MSNNFVSCKIVETLTSSSGAFAPLTLQATSIDVMSDGAPSPPSLKCSIKS